MGDFSHLMGDLKTGGQWALLTQMGDLNLKSAHLALKSPI